MKHVLDGISVIAGHRFAGILRATGRPYRVQVRYVAAFCTRSERRQKEVRAWGCRIVKSLSAVAQVFSTTAVSASKLLCRHDNRDIAQSAKNKRPPLLSRGGYHVRCQQQQMPIPNEQERNRPNLFELRSVRSLEETDSLRPSKKYPTWWMVPRAPLPPPME